MDIPQHPHTRRYQDPNQAKAYFESCLDTFENVSSAESSSTSSNSDSSATFSMDTQESSSAPASASEQKQQQQHQQADREHNGTSGSAPTSSSSSSTAVDYDGHYGAIPPPMPLVYPLLAEALEREGFPGLASMLSFTQDQRLLEQSMEHSYGYGQDPNHLHSLQDPHHPQQQQQQQQQQQHPSMQDDTYLLDYVVQEHNMLMAQHGYSAGGASSSSSSSSSAGAVGGSFHNSSNLQEDRSMQSNSNGQALPQDANNSSFSLMGDMQPLELMQYNSLLLDRHYFDALPYSMVEAGCGADSAGGAGWCDSPQSLGLGGQGNYFPDQFSQPLQIPQQPRQPHAQHQPHQHYHHNGFYDNSSSGSSSNAASSSAAAGSSSAGAFNFAGLNMNGWSSSQLYPQGDYLLERKQQAASGHGMPALPGHHAHVQPLLEPAEEEDTDDDDDDVEGYDHDDGDLPGLTSSDYQQQPHQHQQPYEDSRMPPQSQSNRTSRRIPQGQRQEDHQQQQQQQQHHYHHHQHQQQQHQQQYHPYQYQPYPPTKRTKSDPTSGQRRPSSGANGHSRHSSMSSVHSTTSMMLELLQATSPSTSSPPSSASPSSSSMPSPKGKGHGNRSQMETIEKRMHPCTFDGCDKSFTRAFNLRSHLNTHNGERPHKCPEEGCEWDFVRRHDLDRHIKSKHMANKPYACKQCTSRFGRSDALQRHRRLENHI